MVHALCAGLNQSDKGYTKAECSNLVELVLSKQYYFGTGGAGAVPSAYTLIKRPPCPREDIPWELQEQALFSRGMNRLQKFFLEHIQKIDEKHFYPESQTNLDDFLDSVKESEDFSLICEESLKSFHLQVSGFELKCPIDEMLKKYFENGMSKLVALYHRSIR